MIVWVVTHESPENGTALRGVFSSEKLAKNFIYSEYESSSTEIRRASRKGLFITDARVIDEGI